MKPIPVGLIGVGRHGSRYLHHLLADETGGRLLALSRRNLQEGLRLAEEHHLRFYPDWHELLADRSLQAVLVVTHPSLHLPIALEAIKCRKAILLEKPLALDSGPASQMVEAANGHGIPIMVAQTLRYEPAIRKLQTLGPSLGQWQYLSCTMGVETRPLSPEKTEGWGNRGILMELGIHLLDLIRVLTEDEVASVSAEFARPSPREPESRALLTLTTRKGLCSYLDISRVGGSRITRVEIVGAQGRALADWSNGFVSIVTNENGPTTYPCPQIPTLVPLLQDFFHGIHAGMPMPITGEDGLQAVRIADACYRSAESGKGVLIG